MSVLLRCVQEWKEDSICVLYDTVELTFKVVPSKELFDKLIKREIKPKNLIPKDSDDELGLNYTLERLSERKGFVRYEDFIYNTYQSHINFASWDNISISTVEIIYKNKFYRVERALAGVFTADTEKGREKTNLRVNGCAIPLRHLKGNRAESEGLAGCLLSGEKDIGKVSAVGVFEGTDTLIIMLGGGFYAFTENNGKVIFNACYPEDEPDGYWQGLGLMLEDNKPKLRPLIELGDSVTVEPDEYCAWYTTGMLWGEHPYDLLDTERSVL